jgi:hypothetical protein
MNRPGFGGRAAFPTAQSVAEAIGLCDSLDDDRDALPGVWQGWYVGCESEVGQAESGFEHA